MHRRASALDNKNFGSPINAPRAKASRGDSNILVILASPLCTKERVLSFLWVAGDHQACKVESKEHGHIAFESIIRYGRSLSSNSYAITTPPYVISPLFNTILSKFDAVGSLASLLHRIGQNC